MTVWTRFLVVTACAVIVAATAPPAGAQPAPRMLTLIEAVTLALQQNQQLRAAAFDVAIARAQLAQVKAQASGQINAQASYTRTNEPKPITLTILGTTVTIPPASPNLYDARLILQYPLYTGGRIEAQIALAEANVRGAEAALARMTQQIAFQARQAYYQVLLAQANITVADQAAAQAAENLRVARARVAAGASPRFDEVQAEVAVANARTAQVRARAGLAQVTQGLDAVLNLVLETPLQLRDGFAVEPVRTPLERLVARAVEQRPELAELRARAAAAQAGIDLAESGGKPSVALTGVTNYTNTGLLGGSGTGSLNWSVTLAATLNLFDGGITRERINEARLRLEQLKAVEAQTRQGIELEVRQVVLNLLTVQEELAGADALIAQAREALRIANVRFSAGVGTSLEVLGAQAQAAQAESSKAQALFAYNVARATLERAVSGPVE